MSSVFKGLRQSIHYSGTLFPYQAVEIRPAQESSVGCGGLHIRKFEEIEHSFCIYVSDDRYLMIIPGLLEIKHFE
jgi:hypothetical protein